jgi:thioredoxin reductase
MNTTAEKSVAVTSGGNAASEPVKLLRRIGSTTVEVTVHFSQTSKETMADIVRRLLEREVDKVA